MAARAARLGLEQVLPDRTETEGEDEEHVDSQDLKSLRAAEAQCEDLEVPLDVVDMEESAAAEEQAMMEAQAQAAALIDTLQGDMHTCGRCQEIVLEVNMAPATSGEFRNSWLCRNEEACIARATAGGRGARVRRKRKEFE